jgi:hypothetical protein
MAENLLQFEIPPPPESLTEYGVEFRGMSGPEMVYQGIVCSALCFGVLLVVGVVLVAVSFGMRGHDGLLLRAIDVVIEAPNAVTAYRSRLRLTKPTPVSSDEVEYVVALPSSEPPVRGTLLQVVGWDPQRDDLVWDDGVLAPVAVDADGGWTLGVSSLAPPGSRARVRLGHPGNPA